MDNVALVNWVSFHAFDPFSGSFFYVELWPMKVRASNCFYFIPHWWWAVENDDSRLTRQVSLISCPCLEGWAPPPSLFFFFSLRDHPPPYPHRTFWNAIMDQWAPPSVALLVNIYRVEQQPLSSLERGALQSLGAILYVCMCCSALPFILPSTQLL